MAFPPERQTASGEVKGKGVKQGAKRWPTTHIEGMARTHPHAEASYSVVELDRKSVV